jgi:hypothetical protein
MFSYRPFATIPASYRVSIAVSATITLVGFVSRKSSHDDKDNINPDTTIIFSIIFFILIDVNYL